VHSYRGAGTSPAGSSLKAGFMRLKAIFCQVLTREMEAAAAHARHTLDLEAVPMGLHSLGVEMRPHLQERIDAADGRGYDAIVLGYALCGRGTEGLRSGRTMLVLPRAHDCIGLLMGSRHRYKAYFEDHPGSYYRSPGWVEFPAPDLKLEPAFPSQRNPMGDQTTLKEFIYKYGEENGRYLFDQYSTWRQKYSGLAYISTGVPSDAACRARARAEAEQEGWSFDEVRGTFSLLERLINGPWDAADFLVVPPGAAIRARIDESIVELE